MTRLDKLMKLVEYKNGYILTRNLSEYNLDNKVLSEAVSKGLLIKQGHGFYTFPDTILDPYLKIQKENSKIIFSNETALHLHNLSDRTPIFYSVSVPRKSNTIKQDRNIRLYYVDEKYFDIGIVEMNDPFDNSIFVYDIDRTFCDIVKNENKIDRQIFLEGVQNYMGSNKSNKRKALKYAEKLNVLSRVKNIFYLLQDA